MEIIKISLNSNFNLDNISIALGNFDGFHRGHFSLIEALDKVKETEKLKKSILIFENHSRDFLSSNENSRLMSFDDKIEILKKCKLDYVFVIEFDERIKNLTSTEFLDFLTEKLNVKHIVVGEDYKFSKNREGNSGFIFEYMSSKNFSSTIVRIDNFNGKKISSTDIISMIKSGDVKTGNILLNRTYSIKGIVKRGYQRGRQMGFPTANVVCNFNYVIPKDGVYFTKTKIRGIEYFSFTSIGYNPTFDNKDFTVETHIFDFSQNIYHEEIEVFFIEKIRENEKFENIHELVEQIKKDKLKCEELKELLV